MAPKNPIVDVVPPMDEGDSVGLDQVSPVITEETHEQKRPPMRIVWRNVAIHVGLHMSALYGLTLIPSSHPFTWLFSKYLTKCNISSNFFFLFFVCWHCSTHPVNWLWTK